MERKKKLKGKSIFFRVAAEGGRPSLKHSERRRRRTRRRTAKANKNGKMWTERLGSEETFLNNSVNSETREKGRRHIAQNYWQPNNVRAVRSLQFELALLFLSCV